jgi:hypothetical protein
MGRIDEKKGMYKEALERFTKAKGIIQQVFGE